MKILLVHTGGTIGMAATDEGFAPRQGVVEAAIRTLEVDAYITLLPIEPLIDSAQAAPEDWNRIASALFEAMDDHDAFVVTHGTDTLAYTAGALCMALRGLAKPVILTGAMLPLTVEGSDGGRNLQDAFAATFNAPPGVWVQFAGKRLHGARVRKSHSKAFDAFEAETVADLPLVEATDRKLHLVTPHRVGTFSVTPGACADLLGHAADCCDGIVLRCYGSGTAPDTPQMRDALNTARARQVPVIAVSQCPEGGMRLGTYAAGKVMRETGCIDGRDMTVEMAHAKMHYALSLHSDCDERRDFLDTTFCGERGD